MTDRDQFAAAALTALIIAMRDEYMSEICESAYGWADAMLRERDATPEKNAGVRDSRNWNTTDHDAAPAAKAAPSVSSVPLGKGLGTGDTFGLDAYRRFVGEVMHWISEATSIYEPRSDGGRRIMADACMQCWNAFDRIAYPTKNHDAVPEATAESGRPLVYEDLPHASGTGDTPMEATGGEARTNKAQSSQQEVNTSHSGVAPAIQPVTKPLPVFLSGSGFVTPVSYAEIDEKRVNWPTNREGSDRPQPVKDGVSDRSTPINDGRLAAMEQLSALDQELELKHGVSGNPMIKAQPCKAAKTDTTPPRNGTPAEGSVPREGTEPVAWLVEGVGYDSGTEYQYLTQFEETAQAAAAKGGEIVPLYRHPQPTLTDAEREAIDTAEASLRRESTDLHTPLPVRQRLGSAAATLRGLMERMA